MTSDLAWLEQKLGAAVQAPDIQAEFQSMMKVFKLSAEEVYSKWEVYDMKSGSESQPLSIERLKDMRDQIQRDLELENMRTRKTAQTPIRAVKRAGVLGSSPAGGDLYVYSLSIALTFANKIAWTTSFKELLHLQLKEEPHQVSCKLHPSKSKLHLQVRLGGSYPPVQAVKQFMRK